MTPDDLRITSLCPICGAEVIQRSFYDEEAVEGYECEECAAWMLGDYSNDPEDWTT